MLFTQEEMIPLTDTYQEGDDNSMPLDFNTIQEETIRAKKSKITVKTEKVSNYQLTEKDLKQIGLLMKNMEKNITKFATEGKHKLTYDCSKLENPIFFELANTFKTNNPKFYVETNAGTKMIVVDWSGKNEV